MFGYALTFAFYLKMMPVHEYIRQSFPSFRYKKDNQIKIIKKYNVDFF